MSVEKQCNKPSLSLAEAIPFLNFKNHKDVWVLLFVFSPKEGFNLSQVAVVVYLVQHRTRCIWAVLLSLKAFFTTLSCPEFSNICFCNKIPLSIHFSLAWPLYFCPQSLFLCNLCVFCPLCPFVELLFRPGNFFSNQPKLKVTKEWMLYYSRVWFVIHFVFCLCKSKN